MRKIIVPIFMVIALSLSSLVAAQDLSQEQKRQNQKRQEQQRQEQQRSEEQQRRDQHRYEDQQRRDTRQRYDEQQRREAEQRIENKQRQEHQRQDQHRYGQQWPKRYNWSNSIYQEPNWRKIPIPSDYSSPFRWHDSRSFMNERFRFPLYRLEKIRNQDWDDRFPGLHSYRWHDDDYHDYYNRGFWYRGRRIHDAVLFFDDFDSLIGVGFMFDNVFIFLRDDDESYDNHDSIILIKLLFMILSL